MDTHHWRRRWFYTGCCLCWSPYLPLAGWPGSDRSCRCWFWLGHTCWMAVWRQDGELRKAAAAWFSLTRRLNGLDGSPVPHRDPRRNCRPARCRGRSHCWPRSSSWPTGTARPSETPATPAATQIIFYHFRFNWRSGVVILFVILWLLPCAFDKQLLRCPTTSPRDWSFQW